MNCDVSQKKSAVVIFQTWKIATAFFINQKPENKKIILDEILVTELKASPEIIMTGHCLPQKLAVISDYIPQTKEINHPYKRGVPPREGIEF